MLAGRQRKEIYTIPIRNFLTKIQHRHSIHIEESRILPGSINVIDFGLWTRKKVGSFDGAQLNI